MIRRVKVAFTKDVHLPRFVMNIGDTWEVRVDRLKKGGFTLGGGFVDNCNFKVIGYK